MMFLQSASPVYSGAHSESCLSVGLVAGGQPALPPPTLSEEGTVNSASYQPNEVLVPIPPAQTEAGLPAFRLRVVKDLFSVSPI